MFIDFLKLDSDHVIWKLKIAKIMLREITLEEKLVELLSDYGCLAIWREISGF